MYTMVATALAAAAISGLMAWALARRYGWMRALIVPVLALGSLMVVVWQARGVSFQDGMAMFAAGVVFVAPALVGSLLGIVLAVRRR